VAFTRNCRYGKTILVEQGYGVCGARDERFTRLVGPIQRPLRRSDAQPEEKFIHSGQPPSSALLKWQYAYDYGELAHSAGAKSPNPGQGYLAQRHHEPEPLSAPSVLGLNFPTSGNCRCWVYVPVHTHARDLYVLCRSIHFAARVSREIRGP
jgi:hypothetical protein